MHGLGNDYIYVDCFHQPVPADPAALSRRISDRHFGVGGDGLILVCPTDKGDARMRMFNADGSEAEMCGNGVRCVAKFVHDHGLSSNNPLKIETGRGVLTLHLEVKGGKVEQVTVDMGEPILEAEKIPTTLPGPRGIDAPLPGPRAELLRGPLAAMRPGGREEGRRSLADREAWWESFPPPGSARPCPRSPAPPCRP